MNDRYDYNYEKERREAIEAGQRALNSLRAAQKKLESARILETKSLGMKGTYIKVINPYLKEVL